MLRSQRDGASRRVASPPCREGPEQLTTADTQNENNSTAPAWPSHKKGDQRSPEISLHKKSVVRYLYGVLEAALHSDGKYSSRDFIMSGQTEDVFDATYKASMRAGERFAEMEEMFKNASIGKPIEDGETLFRRVKEEMFSLASEVQRLKTRMVFDGVADPEGVAKQSFYNQRLPYSKQGSFAGKSASAASTGTPRPARSTSASGHC